MNDYAWPEKHWDHQNRGCNGVVDAISRGKRRIVLTAPTGMGKSTMMTSLIQYNSDSFGKTSLYTHRRLLLSQIARDFDNIGIDYGIRAAGHRIALLKDTQIGMTQTEGKAVLTHESRKIHNATLVLSDELHAQGGDTLQRLHQMHYDAGAAIVGVSVGGDSGVMIRTDDGVDWMTIKELHALWVSGVRNIESRSFSGSGFVWKKISDVSKHDASHKRCFRIETDYGRSLVLTEDHSIYRVAEAARIRIKTQVKPVGALQLCKGSDLSIGDFVLLEDEIATDDCNPIIPLWKFSPNKKFRVYGDFGSEIEIVCRSRKLAKLRDGKYGKYLLSHEYESLAKHKEGVIRYHSAKSALYPTHVPLSSIAYIMGFYIGDGWVSEKRICFAVERKQVDFFLSKITEIPDYLAAHSPNIREMPSGSVEVRWSHKPLSGLLPAMCGSGASTKKIPSIMFSASQEIIRDFVSGLMDSDGCLCADGEKSRWRYVTTSRSIAMGLCELLKMVGVLASIHQSKPSNGGKINGRQIVGKKTRYDVHFSIHQWNGNNSGHFGRRSPMVIPFGGQPARIRKIEECSESDVYDISIADDKWQTFIASGMLVHNTATPLDLVGEWDELIVAGTTSEGVRCGALVKAYTYCPDEPDMRHIKKYNIGEDLTDKNNRAAIMRPGVFGRVLKHWKNLNPARKPTILFAPDVAGSIYFAEQFHKEGFRSAHIDAKQIWHRGEFTDSSDENRQMILKMVETGEIEVICNRFVLREGINLPMIAHVIFACVFGSLTTYLQAGGRGLRAHHSLDRICVQDHGANFWRHGSLNEDREWKLGMTCAKEASARMDMLRENPEREPITCAKCGAGRLSGDTCHACGYKSHAKSRKVVQIDGTLQLVEGPTLRKRRRKLEEDTEKKWRSVIHAAGSEKWDTTFLAAEAFFAHKEGYWPPRNLPLMPKDSIGWAAKVRQTPKDELT